MKMVIQKRYKDPDDWRWFNSTIEECLDKTEIPGYWKPGSVVEGLKAGLIVSTPFAQYRCTEYTVDGVTRSNNF